ncbi:MAG: hypothetical protein H6733_14235 [Alphaproteobacteria bacterium]|nr:hypothetical protein [Alphaproteobacteria bacterium]
MLRTPSRVAFLVAGLMLSTAALADTMVPSVNLFDPLSVKFKEGASAVAFLDKCVERLGQDKELVLKVSVHADERYGMLDNTYLAHERSKRLEKWLKRHGAKKKQLVFEAVGHTGVENTSTTAVVTFSFSDGGNVAWPGKG